jgi:hypothetical protein
MPQPASARVAADRAQNSRTEIDRATVRGRSLLSGPFTSGVAVEISIVELRLGPSDICCTLSFILDQEATR